MGADFQFGKMKRRMPLNSTVKHHYDGKFYDTCVLQLTERKLPALLSI